MDKIDVGPSIQQSIVSDEFLTSYVISVIVALIVILIALYYTNYLKIKSENTLQNIEEHTVEEHSYLTNGIENLDDLNVEDEIISNEANSDDYDKANNRSELMEKTTLGLEQMATFCEMSKNQTLQLNEKEYGHKKIHTENNGECADDDDMDRIDNSGLVRSIRSLQNLKAQLTEDQLAAEKKVEQEQMATILELLKKQQAELNVQEIDEIELNEQLNLYR